MTRLLSLTLAAFAIGVSEFVLAGLLPAVAGDTGVGIGTAGLLVTGYALAITLLSPPLTSLLSRYDSRTMLTGLIAVFALGNLVVALSPGFAGLMLGRVLAGAAHGTFFALGAPVAAALVPREKAGQAISLVFLGLTVAMVTGVPAGTALGTAIGWRSTFAVVAALGLTAAVAVRALLPAPPGGDGEHGGEGDEGGSGGNGEGRGKSKGEGRGEGGGGVRLREQLGLLTYRPLALTYAVTGLGFGATFAVFTYLEPLLTRHAGYSATGVTWILMAFGAATVAGNLLGGRLTDRRGAVLTIRCALAGLLGCLAALLFTADHALAVAVNVAVWGVFAFLISPAVQTHSVRLASARGPGAEKAASGLNIAAFNAGVAASSFCGGLALDGHGDPARTPWVALAFALVAAVATAGIGTGARARRDDQDGRPGTGPAVNGRSDRPSGRPTAPVK